MPSPHEEVTDKKQTRRQFRKERKRESRRARRQQYAQARDQRLQLNEEEQLKQHSEYLQQKRLWEEREQRYELINAVRKKAEEAELKAREAAKQKWRDALLRMLPPIPESKPQQTIRMPNFVSGDTMQDETNWP